jgi:hypothetical protein
MKFGRYILPGVLLGTLMLLVFSGGYLVAPEVDLTLRVFLVFSLGFWWFISRNAGLPLREPDSYKGSPIDAQRLISGIAEARASLDAKRPKPDSVQHYRKTLLVMAHRAIAEASYFKHRERAPEEEHAHA